jgi:hypothetical protein
MSAIGVAAMKECVYCGEEFKGKGVVVDGEAFCSAECAKAYSEEEGVDDEEDEDFDYEDE